MNQENLDIFNDSLTRCTKNLLFLDHFYQTFISDSQDIREKFKNTNMEKQKKVLMVSLANMVIAYERPEILRDIAVKHNAKHINIEPDLYLSWLECLILTVKKCDPDYDVKVELAWRDVMQKGINYMISHYQPS